MKSESLLEFLKYVSQKVPYYRDLFLEHNINPSELSDFSRIPVLTKEIIQKEQSRLISDDYSIEKLYKEKTSGSTGMPLKCYYDFREKARRSVELWKERKRNCPDIFGKKMVSFHGGGRRQGAVIEEIDNVLYINYMTMNHEKLVDIYEAFCNFNPFFVRGLPSVMHTFVLYCRDHHLSLNHLGVKYVEMLGEYALEATQNDLKAAFPQAMICDFYGSQEFFCMAYSCREETMHISGSSVYIETQNDDCNGFGEILITGYQNRVMPFIRYKIGDIGKIHESECPCGRTDPILILKSARVMEYIWFDNLKINGDLFKTSLAEYEAETGQSIISQFQVIQISKTDFEIRIRAIDDKFAGPASQLEMETFVRNRILQKIGLEFKVQVAFHQAFYVDPKTMKFKMYRFLTN